MLTLKEQEKTSISCTNQTDAGRELRGEARLEGGCSVSYANQSDAGREL